MNWFAGRARNTGEARGFQEDRQRRSLSIKYRARKKEAEPNSNRCCYASRKFDGGEKSQFVISVWSSLNIKIKARMPILTCKLRWRVSYAQLQ